MPSASQTVTDSDRSDLEHFLNNSGNGAENGRAFRSHHNGLTVKRVRRMGRGVFATRSFRKNEIVEVCPCILLDRKDHDLLWKTELNRYVFMWDRLPWACAVVLGYGSLYNHSDEPNLDFTMRTASVEMIFRAVREIEAGSQLFIDYGYAEGEGAYKGFVRTKRE